MLKIALVSITSFVLIATGLLFYQAGVFDRVKFFEDQKGPYYLVYKEYTGTYSAVGVKIKNVHQYLTDVKKISSVIGGFTVFYDNPVNKNADSLRSISGVITDTLVQVELPFKSDMFGKSYCIIGKYPLRSFFSFTTGIYKIYGALEKYAKSKNTSITGPVMEVIDTEKKVILYIVPVSATADFPSYGK